MGLISCGDPEGFGPLSPTRSDFTPCFVDSTVDVVSLALIVIGSLEIYFLRKRTAYPVAKDWHYWLKLIVVACLTAASFLRALLEFGYSPPQSWLRDVQFWTPLLVCVAFAVALALHHLEHARSRVPSGVLLFFWLAFIIVNGIQLRQSVSLQDHLRRLPRLVLFAVLESLAIFVFALEWLVPKKWSQYSAIDDDHDECPTERATVFSLLTFGWMTPMMKRGYTKFLTEDDLWDLRAKDTSHDTETNFARAWDSQLRRQKPNLWFALLVAFGCPFGVGTLFKIVQDILAFAQPQLLRFLISFVASYSSDTPQPLIQGLAIAGLMFATSVVQTAALHQYFMHAFETGMRVKSGLTAAIYRKSTRLSNEGRAAKSTGDIVNLQAVDTQRLQDLTQYGQQIWSAPFQIVLCMLSLYQLLGPSMFAGVVIMILMIPLNGLIASLMKTLQKRQMKNKDARTRLMTEILNHIKSIKLYGWTAPFMQKLDRVRNEQELRTLRKIGVASAFASFTWSSTPFLVSCSTFAVFVFTQDKALTTEIVFPALTLFNLLTFPLAMLPMVITAFVEATVAADRISSFLRADELQDDAVRREEAVTEHGDESVTVSHGTFTWDKNEPDNDCLKDVSFTATKGSLSCILGRVGSGKSSFLQAILGELHKREGEVVLRGSTAYVSQQYFIMNASIRENIIFGHRYDPDFYQRTVSACALLEDFQHLPDGDETQVGEKGISLSGGQKARVTLARAVYARADIYLLDDPLSAVDQHVGKHLIENVFGSKGVLSSKTRLMATNSIPVLREADRITLIQAGEFVEAGSYDSVMAAKGSIYDIIRHMKDNQDQNDDASSGELTIAPAGASQDASSEEDNIPELAVALGSLKSRRVSLRRASAASLRRDRRKIADEEAQAGRRTATAAETSEKGKVKWSVYAEYAKACNLWGVFIYAFTLTVSQALYVGGNLWLKEWSEANSEHGGNPQIGKYLGIYFAFGMSAAILVVLQNLVLWIFCAIEAARKLHDRMALSIFRSPMSFFETTPAGRILNRFSNDVYRIDEVLCRSFNMLFANSARSFATIAIISYTTPPFIVVALPLAFLYLYIQGYYLRTSRELKRLDSVSRSPVYAHFQETLGGISTIRAYRQQDRFIRENEYRMDENLRAYFPSINANRWLAVRLEFIGSIIILGAAGLSIFAVASGSGLSPGAVGLAMSYALQITQSLNWIVRQTVEVETNIVSVERTLEYSTLPSEAPEIIPNQRPASSWPAEGGVSFRNFSTRYREGLDLVLKDINLDIHPREKIGIVGRTGAGKSSLTLSLFRIIEAASGSISVDSVNTSSIGLHDLRSRLSIIPQDAAIFEGTIRDNLDPRGVHDDTELWSVLEMAHLKEKVSTMEGKLDAPVLEGGSNLSVGEKALVSLARALLAPSHVMVMDEATGSLDTQTDTQIQQTIRELDSTIITIAHRINTIIDYDRIVLLDHGEIKEVGHPYKLLMDKEGMFYGMCKETGELDHLTKIAREAYLASGGAIGDGASN